MRRFFLFGLVCLELAACATPTTQRPYVDSAAASGEAKAQAAYAIKVRLEERQRLAAVGVRLLRANVDQCPDTRRVIGVQTATFYTFSEKFRDAARETLGLGEAPQILLVEPDSPAAKAGLKVGDSIMAVGSVAITPGPGAQDEFITALRAALATSDQVTLGLTGVGGSRRVVVISERACAYELSVVEGQEVNAAADGKAIYVTRGMMKTVANDDELALVVGHELAHDTEKHISAQTRNGIAGGAGGAALDILLAAAGVNTQGAFTRAGMQAGQGYASSEFEAEADYVGLYYMARAGYDTSKAPDFWRKMSVENPDSIFIRSSHPLNPERFVALAAANTEIQARLAAHESLIPKRKVKATVPGPAAAPTR